jgi:uncharacterized protein
MERTEDHQEIIGEVDQNATKTQEESEGEEMTYGEYFILSARQGDLEAVKECLQEEVPIDFCDPKTGNTALHMAAANNIFEVVSFLVEKGAHLNLQNHSQSTALHWASLCGHIEIVKYLCEAGKDRIDVSLKNEFGRIPFEEALQARRTEIAEYLAPLSKLEEEKLYSEIHESQIYAPEEETK